MCEPESVSSTRIYQLKIFLCEISPMVWRRLPVSDDTTLVELHEVIQLSMGWEGYHLWRFTVNGKEYGHASRIWHLRSSVGGCIFEQLVELTKGRPPT